MAHIETISIRRAAVAPRGDLTAKAAPRVRGARRSTVAGKIEKTAEMQLHREGFGRKFPMIETKRRIEERV